MPIKAKRELTARPGFHSRRAPDECGELALLAEFMLHHSVDSLAAAIAVRLGADVQDRDLLANADLGPRRGNG
jgi:hypothetical protein